LKTPLDAGQLPVPQAQAAGNYLVLDGKGQPVAGFSLNVVAAESDLERVPVEELEAVLGKDSVIAVGRSVSLSDALKTRRPPPIELLPYLMILLLIVLALESLLGNRFYRRVPEAEESRRPGEGDEEPKLVAVREAQAPEREVVR
jgi:hypothetical protein